MQWMNMATRENSSVTSSICGKFSNADLKGANRKEKRIFNSEKK
jgi:hypothetical protein